MVSRVEALEIISRQTGINFQTLEHCSRLIEVACIGYDPGQGVAVQDRPVAAEWLALVLLATAVGDADDMLQKLVSTGNMFLERVVTQRETYAYVYRDEECVLTILEVTTHHDPDPIDWGFRGKNFFQVLVGLIEQIAYAPIGEHHEVLGTTYTIDLSWSGRTLNISIEANLVTPDGETVVRNFIFEREATSDTLKSTNVNRPPNRIPIPQTRTLGYFHLRMIAGILATAYDDRLSGIFH